MSTEIQSKLTVRQRQMLELIARSSRRNGFAIVAEVIWPLVAAMPDDLVEKRPEERTCRLTETAKIILKYFMSTETKEEVKDRLQRALNDGLTEADAKAIQSQLAQLTREVEVYRAACQAVVKADLLCNDGSISNQIEAAIEQARAALAMGNGRRSPSCDEREKMLRASLLSFVRVENSFGHTGQHKPNECADCKRVIQAHEALGHGFLLGESALAIGKEN